MLGADTCMGILDAWLDETFAKKQNKIKYLFTPHQSFAYSTLLKILQLLASILYYLSTSTKGVAALQQCECAWITKNGNLDCKRKWAAFSSAEMMFRPSGEAGIDMC